jgi:hypothetical protein
VEGDLVSPIVGRESFDDKIALEVLDLQLELATAKACFARTEVDHLLAQHVTEHITSQVNRGTHTGDANKQGGGIGTNVISLVIYISAAMETMDADIAATGELVASWQATEESVRARFDSQVEAIVRKAHHIMIQNSIDECSPVFNTLVKAIHSRYKRLDQYMLGAHIHKMELVQGYLKRLMKLEVMNVILEFKINNFRDLLRKYRKAQALVGEQSNRQESTNLLRVTVEMAEKNNWFAPEDGSTSEGTVMKEYDNCAEDSYWLKNFGVCTDEESRRMHDLKSWMKTGHSKGQWRKQTTMSVKYMYYEVMGTMMLHDLTGWLKHHSITQFKFLHHSVIGGMKVHDLTGWLKDSLFPCL